MNALNQFVDSFKPQSPQPPTPASKGTLDRNWQQLKQGITNQISQAVPQGGSIQ